MFDMKFLHYPAVKLLKQTSHNNVQNVGRKVNRIVIEIVSNSSGTSTLDEVKPHVDSQINFYDSDDR